MENAVSILLALIACYVVLIHLPIKAAIGQARLQAEKAEQKQPANGYWLKPWQH